MAENSSKNLLNTRSHVLRSSVPAKRYPLMGTQHITQKTHRFSSKTPKNAIFTPEKVIFSGFLCSTLLPVPVKCHTTKRNAKLCFSLSFSRVETGLALITKGPDLLKTARESFPRRSLCGRQKMRF